MKQYDALAMGLAEGRLDGPLAVHLRSRLSVHGPDASRRSTLRFVQLDLGERIAGEVAGQETMVLVLDGEVEISTGRERHTGDRGSVAIIAPHVPYSVHNHERKAAHLPCVLPRAAIDAVFDTPLKTLRKRYPSRATPRASRSRTELWASDAAEAPATS